MTLYGNYDNEDELKRQGTKYLNDAEEFILIFRKKGFGPQHIAICASTRKHSNLDELLQAYSTLTDSNRKL